MVRKMADLNIHLPQGVPFLNTYYAYLTAGCNLACQHCWVAPKYQANGGTGGHLDYQLFAIAIEEGLHLGLSSVKLTGGEPLLHPDFIRIVDLLREKELSLTIETNGILLTKSIASYLKSKSTLRYISVSLDGACAETHDAFRGVKGSYEKTVQSIKFLVEVGFHPQVIMSIHKGNINEIQALVLLAENLGAGSVKFNLINSTGRGEKMSERGQTLSLEHLVETGRWVEHDLQVNASIPLYYSWPIAFYSIRRLSNQGRSSCNMDGILGILPDGHLAMCGIGEQIPELCYGLIGKDKVESIWFDNPVLHELRQGFSRKLEGICSECLFRDICRGHCVAENYSYSGRLTAPFWFCHQADQMRLFPDTRKRGGKTNPQNRISPEIESHK
jgi:SynChlorMet cassette radical SAM/SPASM protein ScmF